MTPVINKIPVSTHSNQFQALISTHERVWLSKLFDREEDCIEAASEYIAKHSQATTELNPLKDL